MTVNSNAKNSNLILINIASILIIWNNHSQLNLERWTSLSTSFFPIFLNSNLVNYAILELRTCRIISVSLLAASVLLPTPIFEIVSHILNLNYSMPFYRALDLLTAIVKFLFILYIYCSYLDFNSYSLLMYSP